MEQEERQWGDIPPVGPLHVGIPGGQCREGAQQCGEGGPGSAGGPLARAFTSRAITRGTCIGPCGGKLAMMGDGFSKVAFVEPSGIGPDWNPGPLQSAGLGRGGASLDCKPCPRRISRASSGDSLARLLRLPHLLCSSSSSSRYFVAPLTPVVGLVDGEPKAVEESQDA